MQDYDKIRDMDGDTYCDFVDKIRMEWEKANEEKEAHLKSCDFEMLKESLDMAVVALERQVPAKTIIKDFFKLPVPIGGTVYEREFPKYSNMVIGYRIGRMMGEEPENYEEDYEPDVWYLQL